MNKIDFEKEVLDKKKVFFGLFVILLLAGSIYFFKDKLLNKLSLTSPRAVKGMSTGLTINNPNPAPPSVNLSDKVQTLKNEVTNLNLKDIASSSPQVQKILDEVKSLGNLPKNEAKAVCEKICTNF